MQDVQCYQVQLGKYCRAVESKHFAGHCTVSSSGWTASASNWDILHQQQQVCYFGTHNKLITGPHLDPAMHNSTCRAIVASNSEHRLWLQPKPANRPTETAQCFNTSRTMRHIIGCCMYCRTRCMAHVRQHSTMLMQQCCCSRAGFAAFVVAEKHLHALGRHHSKVCGHTPRLLAIHCGFANASQHHRLDSGSTACRYTSWAMQACAFCCA